MALQKAIEFLEYARLDTDLDNKINQVISSDAGKIDKYKSIISIAKKMGYSFTISEWEEALLMPASGLDEDEFLNVAGGLNGESAGSNSGCKGIGWSM